MSLLITDAGIAAATAAGDLGVSYKIAYISVGTEGYIPTVGQIALKNEIARVEITKGFDNGNGQLHGEAVFDSDNEFVGKELGYHLTDGTLFAVDSRAGEIISVKRSNTIVTEAFDLNLANSSIDNITVAISGVTAATDEDIDNKAQTKRMVLLPQLWRALTPIRDRANEALSVAHSKSNPNLLINGDFSVNQRGLSEYVIDATKYTVDMLICQPGARVIPATLKLEHANGSEPFASAKYVTFAGEATQTTAVCYTGQRVENYAVLRGKSVTISFWYRSDTDMKVFGELYGPDSSGVLEAHWIEYNLIKASSEWVLYTGVFDVDFAHGDEGVFGFFISTAKPDAFSISFTEMKLEMGSVATPFVPDHPQVNLAKCQRYYQRMMPEVGIGVIANVSTVVASTGFPCHLISFAVEMRTWPTVKVYAWDLNKIGAPNKLHKIMGVGIRNYDCTPNASPHGISITPRGTPFDVGLYWGYWEASAEL